MKNMKLNDIKGIIFVAIVLALTAFSAYPQQRFSGKVTEVLDGKTFVMQTINGKFTCVLQYIEIPEPEQPLRQAVKDHLEKIILSQFGEFKPLSVMKDRLVGQLMIGNVDISQQMLRDGAAWYSGSEKNPVNLTYSDNEAKAKAEKRGVWGIENLKPAWEFREDKEKSRQAELIQNKENSTPAYGERIFRRRNTAQSQFSYDIQSDSWNRFKSEKEVPEGVKVIGGVWVAQETSGKYGIFAIPPARLKIGEREYAAEVYVSLMYFYANDGKGNSLQKSMIIIESLSEKVLFLKNNNLVVIADNQKINIGKARRAAQEMPFGYKEVLTYQIKRDVLEKIAKSQNIKWEIGGLKGEVGPEATSIMQNMIGLLP
jgi:endonuclease YncB( thermonuclease family)